MCAQPPILFLGKVGVGMSKISDKEYSACQEQVLTITVFVKTMPLQSFLDRITHCESVAPLVNPTLYIRAADNLQKIKELAEGLLKFQKVI